MEEYLLYNHEYSVVICRQHKYAITKDWIGRHFQEYHKTVPLKTRKEIEALVSELNLLDPIQVQLPSDTIPVDGLTIYNGFKCSYDGCGALNGTVTSIKEHCKKKHKWIKSVGVMWTEQTVQTFFVGSHLKYVFFNCF